MFLRGIKLYVKDVDFLRSNVDVSSKGIVGNIK